ncbi:MAG: hypothetical protein QOK14_1688, partial [Frankiaceae bacterium]|nr:hypothetical protein [Frankiaceae bacterium]
MFSTSVIRRCLGLAALVVLIQAAPAFATSDVVISQFRTQGVTNGDFVDLVNRSDHTVHLAQGGWRVSFLTADDSAPNPVNWNYGSVCSVARSIDDSHLIPAVTLAPGQHYLITQAGWTGTGGAASDMTFVACGNLPDTAAILTFDGGYDASTNNPIGSDSVGYGRVPLGNFSGEGNNLAIPPNDGSVYQRKTANGLAGSQDTDNSVNDWVTAAASPANYPSTVPKPDGSTDAPTAIIDTTATLHATVNPHGLPVTDCHYDIGLTTSYGTTVPCSSTPSGLSNVAVTGAATGLQSSKTYFYRIVATTSRGTLTGSPQSFTTLAANPGPTGTTDPATNNFAKSAIVKGTINVHGKTVSDCHFDYGKGSFTATAPCAPAPSGADAMPVSAQLTDLDPSSTYQFRLVVTTNGTPATLTGTTRTFTTTALTTTTHQLVISQFRTQGVTGGDYVDLMNITNGTLHVPTGWSLWNTNATGQNQCVIVSNGPAIALAPGQHYLVTQSGWVGTPAADRTSNCSVFDDGGYLSLNLGQDPVTQSYLYPDTVYYGTYPYGSPYNPLPTNGNSLQRRNSGKQDTDISVDDFVPVSTIPQDAPGTAPAPTGSIAAPTSTTQTAATMNGSVDPKMGAVSVCKFQWGDTASYGNETNCATTPSGADNKPVSASLTGLTASHDYHYRLVVTTTGGTLTTDDQSLRTSDPLPVPTAGAGTSNGTGSATKVRAATVTLGGSVNPHNAAVTQCYFDLGTGGSYTTTVPCSPASPTGLNDVAVSGAATDLSPSTTYQFRLHVIGAYGDLVGDQQQFTTTAVVPTSDPVVISQFRTQGPGGDFVDLVNKSTALFTIPAGWSMTDGDGNSVCSVVTNGPEITLAPGQHYLIAENGYTGSPARDLAINGSCGSLRDTNAIVSFGATGTGDQVAYGAPGGFASIGEPDPIATVPSNGNALQRRGGGTRDTGSNSDDFVSVAASPRNYASDAPPATLSTDTPTSIASVKATLQGTINPAGETISDCQFQYATDAEHTTSTTYP